MSKRRSIWLLSVGELVPCQSPHSSNGWRCNMMQYIVQTQASGDKSVRCAWRRAVSAYMSAEWSGVDSGRNRVR